MVGAMDRRVEGWRWCHMRSQNHARVPRRWPRLRIDACSDLGSEVNRCTFPQFRRVPTYAFSRQIWQLLHRHWLVLHYADLVERALLEL